MKLINNSLTLLDLPLPPKGKIGFPWSEQSQPLPEAGLNDSKYPRISIVTPSFNQGQFLEETIRSVLLQGYPNLEYIIIDGGSTDNSVEIIKKYEQFLAYWISEPDYGQANAINKGLAKCTGSILAFLNSDDLYLPNTLNFIVELFKKNSKYDFICAKTMFIDKDSKSIKGFEELFDVELNCKTMTEECHIAQPSTFFQNTVLQKVGYFNEYLHYSFDYEFWLRAFISGMNFMSLSNVVSQFRIHNDSKTESAYHHGKFAIDYINIYQSLLTRRNLSFSYRYGLIRGLMKATRLLCVNFETTKTVSDARLALWSVIMHNPEILIFPLIWRNMLSSLTPVSIRRLWRRNNIKIK